jgi:hypothetical protein
MLRKLACWVRTARSPAPTSLSGDGTPAGQVESRLGFFNFVSWTGLDIGRDRGSPVSHYESPFEFTGNLIKVTVTMDDDQKLDADGIRRVQMAQE